MSVPSSLRLPAPVNQGVRLFSSTRTLHAESKAQIRCHTKGFTLPIVDDLLQNAYEDTQLLIKNDQLGDVFSVSRDVEFLLRAPDEEKANTVCSFINDNQYGVATVQEQNGKFSILVVVHMPITQNVLCSVSALMTCLAAIFSLDYDGWGSVIKNAA